MIVMRLIAIYGACNSPTGPCRGNQPLLWVGGQTAFTGWETAKHSYLRITSPAAMPPDVSRLPLVEADY